MDMHQKYLCCVDCRGQLRRVKMKYICKKCGKQFSLKNGIFSCLDVLEGEKNFSKEKWDIFYKKYFSVKKCLGEFKKVKTECDETYNIWKRYAVFNKQKVYLEIGSGVFFMGNVLSSDCKLVIGIDFSLPSLMAAKKVLDARGVKNYILIHGDILKMPIKSKVVDILYGGGVIEHFKDTAGCIKEYARVMKKKGVAINAVPYLNLAALTYRQNWGNIPDFPVIKQVAEFIHMKLLKGRHMYFGYELSFTKSKMIRLHKKYGFKNIKFTRLETKIFMCFLPKFVRPFMKKLAENCSWFWPMMLVVAEK